MALLLKLQKIVIPALFITFYMLEPLMAARRIPSWRNRHFFENMKLAIISLVLFAVAGSFIISLARGCQDIHFGLFNIFQSMKNNPLIIIASLFAYDLVNYGIHRAYHSIDALWSIHRVHHIDPYIDVSSAFRFHPLETVFRLAVQITAVGILGIPPLTLAIYAVLVAACLCWSHANIKHKDEKWWFWMDKLIVMPDVHRVHHSKARRHHDKNYGIAFVIWDRLLGTYLAPSKITSDFEIGLNGHDGHQSFTHLLKDPLHPPSRP